MIKMTSKTEIWLYNSLQGMFYFSLDEIRLSSEALLILLSN